MKSIVFLFAAFETTHAFDKAFSNQSAFDRCLVWYGGLGLDCEIYVAVNEKTKPLVQQSLDEFSVDGKILCHEDWTTAFLLEQISKSLIQSSGDFAVFTFADRPFLDLDLSKKVLEDHKKYLAEYTFADGYPLGFAPEVIDKGTVNILSNLSKENQKASGDKKVSLDSIFSVMRGDINSFEIEAVIAPKDYRMLRLDFSCGTKQNFLACKNLYQLALDSKIPFNAISLTELSEKSVKVQRTVPSFYNVQICPRCWSESIYSPYFSSYKKKYGSSPLDVSIDSSKIMRLESFRSLVKQIADFSENAVIGFGEWGECLCVENICDYVSTVLSYPGLSVLIETDGLLITEELAQKISDVAKSASPRNDGGEKINWIVRVDAFTSEKYVQLHPEFAVDEKGNRLVEKNLAFARCVNSVSILEKYFENCVYPQMLRMKCNEDELEQFYRFWHDKNSPSKGKIIVQKYDNFCGAISDEKPADLSPLKRNPCWHLKRDMVVLWNGDVPLCREWILDNSIGNVFQENIKDVWEKLDDISQKHIDYCNLLCANKSPDFALDGKCGACDEYYTFNF